MIINLVNLRAGLVWFGDRWGTDLVNGDYYGIYEERAAGVTEKWWETTVGHLGKWQAYRGRYAPNSREEITKRGHDRLPDLASAYSKLMARSESEPCIADVQWEDLEPIFKVAYAIKPSPVFAGKMCHFLLPKAFIVMDNIATQASHYEVYWRGMRDGWHSFKDKPAAMKSLKDSLICEKPIHERYPFETKIMEMCHIGACHLETEP
jgi:hypothetical protein